MKLLLAVPFFKNIPYTRETLQSVIAQSDPEFQAIVLDNATDANESAACAELVRSMNDPHILYLKNPVHLDMASNWNRALDYLEAHPEYSAVSIVHSDDRLLPDYVKVMRESLREYPDTTAFFSRTVIIDETGRPAFSFADWYKTLLRPSGDWVVLAGIDGLAKLIDGNFIFCPTLCFNRNFIKGYRFENRFKMVIDFDLTTRMLLEGRTYRGYYAKPLYEYRRHAQNATAEMNRNFTRFREEHAFYIDLASRIRAKGQTALADKTAKARITKLNLAFHMAIFFIRLQWNRLPEHFRLWKELFGKSK